VRSVRTRFAAPHWAVLEKRRVVFRILVTHAENLMSALMRGKPGLKCDARWSPIAAAPRGSPH